MGIWILGWISALLLVTITGFFARDKKWYPILWIPAVGSLGAFGWLVAASLWVAREHYSRIFFIFLVQISPILVLFGMLLWKRPRVWSLWLSTAGVAFFLGAWALLFIFTTETVRVCVTYPNGEPVRNVAVLAEHSSKLIISNFSSAITNSDGEAVFYPTKHRYLTNDYRGFTAFLLYNGSIVYLNMTQGEDSPKREICVSWPLMPNGQEDATEQQRVRAFVSNRDVWTIPLVVQRPGQFGDKGLAALWKKQWPDGEIRDLTLGVTRNMEAFLERYQSCKTSTSYEEFVDLSVIASLLKTVDSLQRDSRNSNANEIRGQVCEYLMGTDPKDSERRRDVLREYAQTRADQMIQWLKPSLTHGEYGFRTLQALGPLARASGAQFAELYTQSDDEAKEAFLNSLGHIVPEPKDILFLLEIEDVPSASQGFSVALGCRSRKDIDADWAVIQAWIDAHTGKLTPDQIESIKAELKDRRR